MAAGSSGIDGAICSAENSAVKVCVSIEEGTIAHISISLHGHLLIISIGSAECDTTSALLTTGAKAVALDYRSLNLGGEESTVSVIVVCRVGPSSNIFGSAITYTGDGEGRSDLTPHASDYLDALVKNSSLIYTPCNFGSTDVGVDSACCGGHTDRIVGVDDAEAELDVSKSHESPYCEDASSDYAITLSDVPGS